jgi:parallel beta-helix repeat protein
MALGLGTAGLAACGDDGASDDGFSDVCSVKVKADSADPTDALLEAMIDARAGDVICLEPGTYGIERELSLSVRDVTLRGDGDSRDEVVLDFADQSVGDDGITVTADDFTIENMTVKNTKGNGVVVTGAERPTFRNLLVTWDGGSVTENGAYAVYPVHCSDVLIEDCEIVGASDAGIYVGQTRGAVVRNNEVHGNVAGIEIENTDDADVYGNHAYDNTAGILAFVLPNLEKKDGKHNLIRDNVVEENNHDNFGVEGTVLAAVPPGVGILLMAADDTEIRGNEIRDNRTTGVLAISQSTLNLLMEPGKPDMETDPYTSKTHVHDNTFANNGDEPAYPFPLLGVDPAEDIVWDGEQSADATDPDFCVREDAAVTVRGFGGSANLFMPDNHVTDPETFECELPPVEL